MWRSRPQSDIVTMVGASLLAGGTVKSRELEVPLGKGGRPSEDGVLKQILTGGAVLRVLVYAFQRPNNNDNHFAVVEYIAQNLSIPASGELGQSAHPPLYYLLAAPLSAVGPPKLVQALSLLFALANLGLLYVLIRDTPLLTSARARRHALLFVALLPQFVLFGNFVSNDSLAFLVGTVIVVQAFRYLDRPTRWNLGLLAGSLGAGLLTKGTFVAFVPVITLLVLVVEVRRSPAWRERLLALGVFAAICFALGSFKYAQNMVHFGKPFIGPEELGFEWVALQQGTYRGPSSLLDVNVAKLVRRPTIGEHSMHSVPLLLYGTFWYSHIPESNFNATRHFPLVAVSAGIYLMAVVPTLLMLIATGTVVRRNISIGGLLRSAGGDANVRIQESLLLLLLLSSLALVLVWGLQHDAWSFFQARLLFAAMFPIALLLGLGVETARQWRPPVFRIVEAALFLLYALFIAYFVIEIGGVAAGGLGF